MNTTALERLRAFRHQIYTTFGCRRDALFEILDALLTTPVIEHPVHLSLAPGLRAWLGSIYDALNAGTIPLSWLEDLAAAQPLETNTAWYAVDESRWPRCDAETSPQRGDSHQHTRHSHGQPIVAGWNYSWLVQIPERCSSWTAQLAGTADPARRKQQRGWRLDRFAPCLGQRETTQPRPIFTFDAGDLAGATGDGVGRARRKHTRRVCAPVAQSQPIRHRDRLADARGDMGPALVCDDPTTWPRPSDEWRTTDAD
jgi:hypothetical protein